jgi:hypothetical protein
MSGSPSSTKVRVTHYMVDGESQQTEQDFLTSTQILQQAGIDPATHYLVQIVGNHEKESYKDTPDKPIKMHEAMKFVSVFTGSTPVS